MSTDECRAQLHPNAIVGLRLIRDGKYFEAHEELELAWRQERGRVRQLYQGILEAAVTYLHITRANYPGALKVYERSMRWLKSWPETCRGVEVGRLRRDLEAAIVEVRRLGAARLGEFDRSLLRPVAWRESEDEGRS